MIYIVDFGTCYKIGQTSDLRKRVQAFKNSRENVECLDIIISLKNPLDQKSVDLEIENELHKRCAKYKITNELFERNVEVLKIFREYKEELGDLVDYSKEIPKLLSTPIKVGKTNVCNRKPVFQYDLESNFINSYESRATAERANNLSRGRVKEALSGRTMTSGGFIWSDAPLTEEEIKMKLSRINKRKTKDTSNSLSIRGKDNILVQYTLDGERIACWSSLTQAGKDLGIPVSSISLCCSGVYKKAGGYRWKIEKMS